MGNNQLNNIYEYNKLENINVTHQDYAGPFIFPEIKNFQKEADELFKNRTIIENNIEKMIKFKDRPCLGRRLKIGENEKGEPIFENKYIVFLRI